MGQTLTNNIYLPDEGERNCYAGLAENWVALDTLVGAYSSHYQNTTIHVTASDKQTWNGKQDALSQTQLDAVNSGIDSSKVQQIATNTSDISSLQSGKANDSDVVHRSGDETVFGLKTFENNRMIVGTNTDKNSVIQFVNSNIVGDSANGSSGLEVYGSSGLEVYGSSVSDANKIGSITIGEFSNNGGAYATIECNRTASGVKSSNAIRSLIRPNGSKELSATTDNDCKLGTEFLRWSKIYGTEYYYGSNNVEFSQKFVTTDTAQTVSGNKTFSSINGVEPSSLSLPSQTYVDISSYFTNTGTGEINTYTAPSNGWIYLRLGNISGCQASVYDSNNNRMWGQSMMGSVEQITIPILKGQTLTTQWNTSSTVYVATARFIPCQGNV